jgi:hypothetical protein
MNIRKKIQILCGSCVLAFFVAYMLTNAVIFRLCEQHNYQCREILNKVGDPLLYSMPALALVFLLLLFKPTAYDAWKKFAVWFVPLAAVLFAVYPMPGSGDLFAPYPEQVYQWVSAAYVLISLGIIARESLAKRA